MHVKKNGLIALLCGALAGGAAAAEDPVVFSFVFVGCNRLDKLGVGQTQSASTANVAQLLQTFADIHALPQRPRYLFLLGDVVKAKKKGTAELAQQLAAWRKLVKGKLDPSIELVVMTGNHELLKDAKTPGGADEVEVPNPKAYDYWQQQMRPYIFGRNGPRKGGADGLSGDEKRLSYSFTAQGVRFVVVNTDSRIDDTTIGDVPLKWLADTLKAAEDDTTVEHVFVLGHKPIAAPGRPIDSGASNIRSAEAAAFYALLNQARGGAPSKVRAYLGAHAHQWNFASNLNAPPASLPGSVPQIVAGNGGSPPDKAWAQGYFGFTRVAILKSGRIQAESYGRPIPQPDYYAQLPAPQAAMLQTRVELAGPR